MIGHEHVGVACLVKDPRQGMHVDIVFIRPYLHEVVQPASDVSEVDVEDLLVLGKVLHDFGQLLARIIQAFGSYAAACDVPGTEEYVVSRRWEGNISPFHPSKEPEHDLRTITHERLMNFPTLSLITAKTGWISGTSMEKQASSRQVARIIQSPGLLTPLIRATFGICIFEVQTNGLVVDEGLDAIHRRDTWIHTGNQTCIYASTLMPTFVIQAHPWLTTLGGRSLGEALYDRTTVSRSTFEFLNIDTGEDFGFKQPTWARRYAFVVPEGPLTVMEIFSPSFLLALAKVET